MLGDFNARTATKQATLLIIDSIRKTGPWSNKIKQMRKQNTKDTQYNRDIDLCGSPSVGYVH